MHFKELPLRIKILQISTLESLTLGLTKEWYSPAIEKLERKYLPALKTLWLNLTTFKPEGDNIWISADNGLKDEAIPPRQPPTVFFEGLDNPELKLLNIKFPLQATGPMFLSVISAAQNNCRLQNLSELALAGGGWFSTCAECGIRPPPNIEPIELRAALTMLLPMHQLKVLRLSVAPNFLDVLDLEMYREMAEGMPALERLQLGHAEFVTTSEFHGTRSYERVPLHHLAAFCCLLEKLVEVSVGAVDGLVLEENPNKEWVCPGVKKLVVIHWAGRDNTWVGVDRKLLNMGLRTYFPNSDLSKEFSERLSIFDPEN